MNRVLAYLRGHAVEVGSAERQLLDRFVHQRDQDAFAELVYRHGPLVWGVCRRNLPNLTDAEDAFQATFLVLARRANTLTSRETVGPWLYKVAVWCCRNMRRANQRRLGRVRVGLNEPVAATEPQANSDLVAELDSAMLSLPEKYRVPIVLCHLQGWSRQQAAQHLGCPEGTLSIRLNRALAKLRVKLSNSDPAAVLAIGGALAAPAAVANAAVRAAEIYHTSAQSVPRAVLSTSNGVLRMIRARKIRVVAAGLMALMGLGLLCANLPAKPGSPVTAPADNPATRQADAPVLTAGRWAITIWPYPESPERIAVALVEERNGKPAITAVEDNWYKWQLKDLKVEGRRVTFTLDKLGRNDHPYDASYDTVPTFFLNDISVSETGSYRFDGLFDQTAPTRVLGSFHLSEATYRTELSLMPKRGVRPSRDTSSPREWQRYQELKHEFDTSRPYYMPVPEEKEGPNPPADKYYAEAPRLLRAVIANQKGNLLAYEATTKLFGMLERVKPTSAEVDE
jgi:RNA polymerase sigma factor (sigma-70 family)